MRSQRLWAVLLVLDSLFVIVFGGALAAKVYQHWQAPPPRPVVVRRRPAPAAPPASAPAPAPTPVAPAPKAEPKPQPAEPPPAKTPVPKPSLLNEPPVHQSAGPIGGGGSGGGAAKPKALPTEFHLSAPNAKKVELAGAFIVRGNGRKRMVRQSDGTWTLTLYLTPNSYRYHFIVDGKKKLDPRNAESEHGASLIKVSAP